MCVRVVSARARAQILGWMRPIVRIEWLSERIGRASGAVSPQCRALNGRTCGGMGGLWVMVGANRITSIMCARVSAAAAWAQLAQTRQQTDATRTRQFVRVPMSMMSCCTGWGGVSVINEESFAWHKFNEIVLQSGVSVVEDRPGEIDHGVKWSVE